jgi:hypothetical protein
MVSCSPALSDGVAEVEARPYVTRVSRSFSSLVEARIREAQQRGELDGLPGRGKTLPPDPIDDLPAEARLDAIVARNAGGLPEEVELLREIEGLRGKLVDPSLDEELRPSIEARLRARSMRLSILFEAAGRNLSAAARR